MCWQDIKNSLLVHFCAIRELKKKIRNLLDFTYFKPKAIIKKKATSDYFLWPIACSEKSEGAQSQASRLALTADKLRG